MAWCTGVKMLYYSGKMVAGAWPARGQRVYKFNRFLFGSWNKRKNLCGFG